MQVDSIHSLIERRLKNKAIHLPSDFLRITLEARTNPEPLQVKELDYSFTKKFSHKHMMAYNSFRPGKKTGDPKVTNIRLIYYSPNELIKVKLNFDGDFVDLPQRATPRFNKLIDFLCLLQSPIKITNRKWNHLQDLKEVIPLDCHPYSPASTRGEKIC